MMGKAKARESWGEEKVAKDDEDRLLPRKARSIRYSSLVSHTHWALAG